MIHSGCSPKQMSENKNDDEIANHVGYLHVVNPATHAGLTRVVKALMAASLDGGTKNKTKNKQTNKKRSVLWYKTSVSFMTSNKPTMTVKPSPTMTPRDHAIICVQLRSVICVAAKFICHAHMWPINITIRNKVAAGDDGPGLLPGRPHRAGTCQHRDRVCPRRSGGIIIKRDLTDDRVLLVLCAQVCVCVCVCVDSTVVMGSCH